MTAQLSDEELVRQVQKGEILSFEILVGRHQLRLTRFVSRYTRNHDDAEEIVQDSFLKVYVSIDKIDTKRKFTSFLYEIAKNTAISFLRGKRETIPLRENHPSLDHEGIWEQLTRGESRDQVQKALTQLPAPYQNILKLYYFEELSYEEIGSRLKLPINTVRTHLRRGKEKLRKLLT